MHEHTTHKYKHTYKHMNAHTHQTLREIHTLISHIHTD